MRMGPHVHAGSEQELGRTHLVEKDEGTYHLPLRRWEGSAHLEASEIARARHDHRLDGITREPVAGLRVFGGIPAHQIFSFISPGFSVADARAEGIDRRSSSGPTATGMKSPRRAPDVNCIHQLEHTASNTSIALTSQDRP